jgi:hypothetical protein
MIRFLAYGETPTEHASELVGRFVGKDGVMKFRTYSRPKLVTGYSGSRLYVKEALVDHKTLDGEVKLRPIDEWDEEAFLGIKSIAYVCDTFEEAEQVMQACKKSLRIWQEGEAKIKADINSVFSDLIENQPDNDSSTRP